MKKKKKLRKNYKKKPFKKKIFYSKEDSNNSSNDAEEYESNAIQDEKMLMELEHESSDREKVDIEEDEEMVDMEGELISALEKIYMLRRKNKKKK
jgi:hypothetical protein